VAKKKEISRRDLLKLSAGAGVLAGSAGLAGLGGMPKSRPRKSRAWLRSWARAAHLRRQSALRGNLSAPPH
jgi:hypothetical protein